jgi:DNA-binding protein H-NS
MKMPNFSKMTVDALFVARRTIDDLLKKRVPQARKELEDRLSRLNKFFEGKPSRKAKPNGRSKLKGRRVPAKYRGGKGETWSGRGMQPRWLTAAIKGGAKLEDFSIAAGRKRKTNKKAAAKPTKKSAKSASAKRAGSRAKLTKPAKRKKIVRATKAAPSVPPQDTVAQESAPAAHGV